MAESKFYEGLKYQWEYENLGGKLRRVEEKGRSGFPDILMLVDAITHYFELKHCLLPFSELAARGFPHGLSGSQAVELDSFYNEGGAPAWLMVAFGDVRPRLMSTHCTIVLWVAGELSAYMQDPHSNPIPKPNVVFHPRQNPFTWKKYLEIPAF